MNGMPSSLLTRYKEQIKRTTFIRRIKRLKFSEIQKLSFISLVIGIPCGLAAVAFHYMLTFLQTHLIYAAAGIQDWWGVLLVVGLPAIGGLIAGLGLYYLVPEAAGSGIPQVKTAFMLENGHIPGRVIPGKMLLSALNIGSGASLGREGPTVQICAAIASWFGRIFALSRQAQRSLIPMGAAAGLAAAFNTPIAAITFTLEEIHGEIAEKSYGSIVFAAVVAAVVERSILGGHALFEVPAYSLHSVTELFFYALLGLVAALAAVAFNRGMLDVRQYFKHLSSIPAWARPAVGGGVVGLLGLIALMLTGSASVFGIGYDMLALELHGELPLKVLLVLGGCKLIATIVSYGSGSSGGIFGPSLFIGGMVGGSVGLLATIILDDTDVQPGAFALVGMGAVFAGIVRAPITSVIIIFEMTNNYSIILPLMIATMTSYLIASRLSPTPIYDALLLQDGIHLPSRNPHVLRMIPVQSVMNREVVTVNGTYTVEEAMAYVTSLPVHHHAYPVVDANNRLIGIFTFNDLKRAVQEKQAHLRLDAVVEKNVICAYPDQTLDHVLVELGDRNISQLPVVHRENRRTLIGIITMHDIAGALSRENGSSVNGVVPDQILKYG